MRIIPLLIYLLLFSATPTAVAAEELSAALRVQAAMKYWRDESSYTEASMIINRSDWQRTMDLKGWTQGMKYSLIRFLAPPRDAGSASLKKGEEMWSYAPRINRVLKIPPSMMTQSWMGSDFSYNDLAKADDIIDNYSHRFIGHEKQNDHDIATIESVPLENAPVVWGKEILKIRDDNVLLEHAFYDQDMKPIKVLRTIEIKLMAGKLYPTVMRMENLEEKDRWTEIRYTRALFGLELNKSVFTLSNLRNPRE